MKKNLLAPGRWSRLLLCVFLLATLVSGCASTGKVEPTGQIPRPDVPASEETGDEFVPDPTMDVPPAPASMEPVKPTAQASSHAVLKTAFSQVGRQYRYGGTKPETGFDCSGFVGWVYGQYGVKLPRRSGDMMALGSNVARKELKPGDLVFFGRKKVVTHVGIYTGDNKYIHSPRTGKPVQESSLDDRGRGEYYVGARRLLPAHRLAEVTDGQKKAWSGGRHLASSSGKKSSSASSTDGQAQPASQAKADQPKIKEHRVVAGDTLYGLARKYKVSIDLLAQINKISNPKAAVLRPGQKLIVPADGEKLKVATAPKATPAELAAAAQTDPAPKAPANEAAPKAAAQAPAGGRHKIADGDTFYGVAIKYGVKYSDLAAANNISDINSYVLKPGKTMIIPAKSGSSAGGESRAKAKKHTVTSGDTFYGVAKKYGVKSADLASANNIKDISTVVLRPGQTLIIP